MHASAAELSRLRRLSVSEAIELTAISMLDAERLFSCVDASRQSLRKWLPWVDETLSVADVRTFARESIAAQADGAAVQMCIREHGDVVGTIGLRPVDWANGRGWIGYWLTETARGRGLMTESARSLVTCAFARLGLHRLDIVCAAGNSPSRAVAERLGFELEGTAREAMVVCGRHVDLVTYAALARRWRCGRAQVE